ncbi:cellulose acetylase subunit [Bordetella trematum]|uniref:Cellulose acetylase subunit n=1 Tax=Bordetella trematum TaxID=123899 RepID=A0A157SJZ8_9BORD|nr:cellulose acetylase subunit [Bordetella trematum]
MTIPRDMPPDMPPKPPTAHAGERARRASRLAGVVLLLFMLAAILSNAWWSREHRLLPDNLSMQRLLDGGVTHDIAQRLGDMPFSNQAATLQRGLGWLTLGDLGERVRPGCPGWLFLADELQVYPQAEANARARAQTVLQTRQALATQGVDLLVAVVPDKSRVEADRLCGLHRPAAFEQRLQAWADMLRAEGVKVLDLTPALQAGEQEAFLRADSHWSQAGAGAAARAVAEQVRAAGVPLLPEREYDVSTGPRRCARAIWCVWRASTACRSAGSPRPMWWRCSAMCRVPPPPMTPMPYSATLALPRWRWSGPLFRVPPSLRRNWRASSASKSATSPATAPSSAPRPKPTSRARPGNRRRRGWSSGKSTSATCRPR